VGSIAPLQCVDETLMARSVVLMIICEPVCKSSAPEATLGRTPSVPLAVRIVAALFAHIATWLRWPHDARCVSFQCPLFALIRICIAPIETCLADCLSIYSAYLFTFAAALPYVALTDCF